MVEEEIRGGRQLRERSEEKSGKIDLVCDEKEKNKGKEMRKWK